MKIEGTDTNHDFEINRMSAVVAHDTEHGGQISTQSVEALLLFEILCELRRINEGVWFDK